MFELQFQTSFLQNNATGSIFLSVKSQKSNLEKQKSNVICQAFHFFRLTFPKVPCANAKLSHVPLQKLLIGLFGQNVVVAHISGTNVKVSENK